MPEAAISVGNTAGDGESDAFAQLEQNLGAFGYQWLCACAVYPGLRFTLSVYLGRELAHALGRPVPNEDEHAALSRLPWFRTGYMPDELRLRLLADLVPEAAEATRNAVGRLLLAAFKLPAQAIADEPLPLPALPPTWREQVRALIETAPCDAVEHDAILKHFMAGHCVHAQALDRDRLLRRRFGAQVASWLDRRTVASTVVAVLVALLAAWQADLWLVPWSEGTIEETRRIETFRDCSQCPEMVVLSVGEFLMGAADSDSEAWDREKPQHRVQIGYRLAVGRYTVTFDEWDAYVAEGGTDYRPADEGWGRGRRPVINVSWNHAKQYVAWLSRKTGQEYRLLSEAEWEYAARAGTKTPYWWGWTATLSAANYYRAIGRTQKVGSYPPNPWGLYDTAGNVWEWVEDYWNYNYGSAPSNGEAWPTGDCNQRVARGGSWDSSPGVIRSAYRFRYPASSRSSDIGFRVARAFQLSYLGFVTS